MIIKQIIDKNFRDEWNKFVIENSSPASFLQSWQWGEFRAKELNEKILHLAIYNSTQINVDEADERGLIAVVLLIKKTLPFGKWYWECSRGPVIKLKTQNSKLKTNEIYKLLIDEIKKIAKKEKIVFVRFELSVNCHPDENRDPEKKVLDSRWSLSRTLMRDGNDKREDGKLQIPQILTHSKNPENTLLLDLSKSEEEILNSMHPKWRYNIRLAEKKGVSVKIINKDVASFYNLLQQTAKRDKIKIFSKKYYEGLINYFSLPLITRSSLLITVFFAEYKNKILSAIMIIGFGDTATYLHGGSSNEHREIMPNHAIQWQAIKWAKEQNYRYYDFWGVLAQQSTSNNQQSTNWQGIDRFKRGFVSNSTGQEINYPGAKDFVFNKKWYNLFRLGKILTMHS